MLYVSVCVSVSNALYKGRNLSASGGVITHALPSLQLKKSIHAKPIFTCEGVATVLLVEVTPPPILPFE